MLTTLTRMWLTRSLRPFVFRREFDRFLSYEDLERLGLYVHIPFCRSLCPFCPYCKVPYDRALCDRYLDALLEEIHQVGRQHPGRKRVTSLYFGGGTPALTADRLGEVIRALEEHFEITEGIGVELHPDDVTVETLSLLKAAGVTKVSIGIQSFQGKFQQLLGRAPVNPEALSAALKQVPFETVSMDFIFALPGQTIRDLRLDGETARRCGANHVAFYPFIDFTFTPSQVPSMGKREKRRLLDDLTAWCQEQGWQRTSIWTYALEPCAGYSSMTRENFLGFGCSAATLLREQFKINTFEVEAYCRRVREGLPPTSLTLRFTHRQRMVYFLFWEAYSTRVDPVNFRRFFGRELEKAYGLELAVARGLGLVERQGENYVMTPKGAFAYHYYESFYTLAYIDRMWSILRREAFPERIVL